MSHYRLAAVGGTFDHFHAGHQRLLDTALASADRVIIGLTQSKMLVDKKYSSLIESYPKRKQKLLKYITSRQALARIDLIPLTDPFGPTLTHPHIDVLVVSRQTLPGAKAVNRRRQKLNLPVLPVVITPMVTDDARRYLSSTQIRRGLVSTQGTTFIKAIPPDFHLSPNLRQIFSQAFSPIYPKFPQDKTKLNLSHNFPVVLIGDQVVQTAIKLKAPFTHAVIDHRIRRRPAAFNYLSHLPQPVRRTQNSPGRIDPAAISALAGMLALTQGSLIVTGEEDLLAIPVILTLPLKSLVLYGQPSQGIACVTVTLGLKNRLYRLFQT